MDFFCTPSPCGRKLIPPGQLQKTLAAARGGERGVALDLVAPKRQVLFRRHGIENLPQVFQRELPIGLNVLRQQRILAVGGRFQLRDDLGEEAGQVVMQAVGQFQLRGFMGIGQGFRNAFELSVSATPAY